MEQLDWSTQTDKEYWEHIYNHKPICEALLSEGSRVARALFRSKVNHIHNMHRPFGDETGFILLTSLNRSLYDYILMQLNLSFTKCCFENRAHSHSLGDLESLLRAGDKIINAYADCLDESKNQHSHIEKVYSYINSHLGEDLSLARVSSEVYLSKNHLSTLFKNLTGSTFCDYVKQQRIQHARILLSTTDRTIDEIADQCGFNSSTYFSTVFKHEMGVTPSAFRQEFGNGGL